MVFFDFLTLLALFFYYRGTVFNRVECGWRDLSVILINLSHFSVDDGFKLIFIELKDVDVTILDVLLLHLVHQELYISLLIRIQIT
jgi:hypothetical protein